MIELVHLPQPNVLEPIAHNDLLVLVSAEQELMNRVVRYLPEEYLFGVAYQDCLPPHLIESHQIDFLPLSFALRQDLSYYFQISLEVDECPLSHHVPDADASILIAHNKSKAIAHVN